MFDCDVLIITPSLGKWLLFSTRPQMRARVALASLLSQTKARTSGSDSRVNTCFATFIVCQACSQQRLYLVRVATPPSSREFFAMVIAEIVAQTGPAQTRPAHGTETLVVFAALRQQSLFIVGFKKGPTSMHGYTHVYPSMPTRQRTLPCQQ
eukprot:jgi/Botrbrau1/17757/Bobra.0127s0016.1